MVNTNNELIQKIEGIEDILDNHSDRWIRNELNTTKATLMKELAAAYAEWDAAQPANLAASLKACTGAVEVTVTDSDGEAE